MSFSSSKPIEILDVTARDGLQNESVHLSTAQKLELINRAIAAGARRLEVASFAHPKYVPQMADAEAVIAGLPDRPDCTFIGLVMNQRGLDRAIASGIEEVGFVAVSTDTFATKNQGQTRDETVTLTRDMIRQAKAEGRKANVTITTCFGCPFEGEVSPQIVLDMAVALSEAGPHEIAIADTIGVADPWRVEALLRDLRAAIPNMPLRAHFHNTRNTGVANVAAAVRAEVSTIDVSIGGIGGCPFAPAATGNVPAEDVIYMLERGGFETGMDLPRVIEAADWLSEALGKSLPGALGRAGLFPDVAKTA